MGPWITETHRTPDLLKEAGYRYLMDWPADDQPFWMRTRSGSLLSVPYPIEVNDSPTMLNRMQSATDFAQLIVDQVDTMLKLCVNIRWFAASRCIVSSSASRSASRSFGARSRKC